MKSKHESQTMKKGSLRQRKKIRHTPPGAAPGALNIPSDALNLNIKSFYFDNETFFEGELKSLSEIKSQYESHPDKIHWFDIKGFGNKQFLESLADYFKIHRLQLEDVVNVYQRPKAEDYMGHVFFTTRVLSEKDNCIQNDQLSLFLGSNFVISLQDKYEDQLGPIRGRIRQGKGLMRRMGADYLCYALMDVVIDNYYPLLERLGDKLDALQDELISRPSRDALNRVLMTKKDLIMLRRIMWSERDKMNDILRSGFGEISDSTKVYFRDTYDHCIQLMDIVESYREVTASLMDVYHSSVSNKLNQVMKVLTIISTIFIPLTFIVGLYGMNFSRVDPETGHFNPLNMPELYSPYGYITVCVVMVIIVIAQLIFFFKKGWLDKS